MLLPFPTFCFAFSLGSTPPYPSLHPPIQLQGAVSVISHDDLEHEYMLHDVFLDRFCSCWTERRSPKHCNVLLEWSQRLISVISSCCLGRIYLVHSFSLAVSISHLPPKDTQSFRNTSREHTHTHGHTRVKSVRGDMRMQATHEKDYTTSRCHA